MQEVINRLQSAELQQNHNHDLKEKKLIILKSVPITNIMKVIVNKAFSSHVASEINRKTEHVIIKVVVCTRGSPTY